MARLHGSYSASMYDPHKALILELKRFGIGMTHISRQLRIGTRQSLYNYLKKLAILAGNKTTSVSFAVKKALPLFLKVKHAKKRIKEFYEAKKGEVYVSFSGGKDSTVLLHLIRSIYPDIKAVFSNTTNEYLEILDFVKQTLNVQWLTPKQSFNEIVKEYGFPLVSKKVSRQIHDLKNPTPSNEKSRNMYLTGIGSKGQDLRNYKLSNKWKYLIGEPFNITNKCCDILKKNPLKEFEKESGLKPFIGTSALESDTRKSNYIKHGCNIFEKGNEKSRPLSIFSEKDIWNYIKKHNLDYSKIYDDALINDMTVKGETRTGCAYCAFGAGFEPQDDNRFTRLSVRKPKQFKKMMGLENSGVSFSEALSKVGVNTQLNS